MAKPKGNPHDFASGQLVRFKPGKGTCGYEDCIGADDRLSARVVGHTPTRVRIELTGNHRRSRECVAVDAASLVLDRAELVEKGRTS